MREMRPSRATQWWPLVPMQQQQQQRPHEPVHRRPIQVYRSPPWSASRGAQRASSVTPGTLSTTRVDSANGPCAGATTCLGSRGGGDRLPTRTRSRRPTSFRVTEVSFFNVGFNQQQAHQAQMHPSQHNTDTLCVRVRRPGAKTVALSLSLHKLSKARKGSSRVTSTRRTSCATHIGHTLDRPSLSFLRTGLRHRPPPLSSDRRHRAGGRVGRTRAVDRIRIMGAHAAA